MFDTRLKWIAGFGCMLLVGFPSSLWSETGATPDAGIKRPTYRVLRFEEEWSVLAGHDRSETGDAWDAIKYVPLSEDGSIWISFGGQARLRYEAGSNFAFGGGAGARR